MMIRKTDAKNDLPALLDVVALLSDRPRDHVIRGQVGTVVETAGEDRVLVEFSDESGRAFALVPCTPSELIVLHYAPQVAA